MRTQLPRSSTLVFSAALAMMLIVGMQPDSAASYVYQPPAGWHRMLSTASGLGVWVHPGDQGFHQNINVIAERYSGTLSEYTGMSISAIRSRIPGVEIGGVQSATVCGTHPATYFTYAANVRGKLLIYEQMAAIWQGVAYLATYTRLAAQPSLDSARRSLTTLCGGLPPTTGRYIQSGVPGPHPSPSVTPPPATYASPIPLGSVAPTVTPRLQP